MVFNGYRFDTKQIADDAMAYLNSHHELPTKNGLTKFDSNSYTQHADGFYYIAYDAEWTSILGEPTEIKLPINNIE